MLLRISEHLTLGEDRRMVPKLCVRRVWNKGLMVRAEEAKPDLYV